MNQPETTHAEQGATVISKQGSQVGERSVIAQCCLNSAAMLEIADASGHSNEQRARFRELNAKQAALLREAANMADELLEALQTIMGDADHGQGWTWGDRCSMARAAIAKATGER